MSWVQGFVVDYSNANNRKYVSCKDCAYFDESDKSCSKSDLVFGEDKYASWKKCPFFNLGTDVDYYDEKCEKATNWFKEHPAKNKNSIDNKIVIRPTSELKTFKRKDEHQYTVKYSNDIIDLKEYDLVVKGYKSIFPKNGEKVLLHVVLNNGLRKTITFVISGKEACVREHEYFMEYDREIRSLFNRIKWQQ